jgi:hypothetical protein
MGAKRAVKGGLILGRAFGGVLEATMGSLKGSRAIDRETNLGRLSLSSDEHGSCTPFTPSISHDWHHVKGDVARSSTMIGVIGGSGT